MRSRIVAIGISLGALVLPGCDWDIPSETDTETRHADKASEDSQPVGLGIVITPLGPSNDAISLQRARQLAPFEIVLPDLTVANSGLIEAVYASSPGGLIGRNEGPIDGVRPSVGDADAIVIEFSGPNPTSNDSSVIEGKWTSGNPQSAAKKMRDAFPNDAANVCRVAGVPALCVPAHSSTESNLFTAAVETRIGDLDVLAIGDGMETVRAIAESIAARAK